MVLVLTGAGHVVEVLTGQTLEEYMQENIWSVVGMPNTTFHPEHRQNFPLLEMGFRLNNADKSLTYGQNPWPIPAKCDMGGAGIYSTAEDYAKMLATLLSNDGRLLKRETLEAFVRPQLSGDSLDSLNEMRRRGAIQIDIPQGIKVNHALGGLLVSEDIPGRRKSGSMCWDGMTNSNWVSPKNDGLY